MMNHDNRHYSFLGLRYGSSVAKEMFILGLSLDSPHFFQLLAKQCLKHWTYRSLFVSLIILVICFQFQLPVLVHNPYLIPKWLHLIVNEKNARLVEPSKEYLYYTIQYFERLFLSSSGCYKLWLSETRSLHEKSVHSVLMSLLFEGKKCRFFSEVWAQKYSFNIKMLDILE